MGQFSQDFQKVIIFDCCKNDNARGNVQWFQLHSAWTHRIDCITKTISEFIFIKMTTPQTQDVNWTYIRRSEDVQDVFWTPYVRLIYVLCLRGGNHSQWTQIIVKFCSLTIDLKTWDIRWEFKFRRCLKDRYGKCSHRSVYLSYRNQVCWNDWNNWQTVKTLFRAVWFKALKQFPKMSSN